MSLIPKTRLAIIDHHPGVGRGRREVFGGVDDVHVTGLFDRTSDCADFMSTHSVDIIVVDLTAVGLCGLHHLQEARSLWPDTPIVVLSDNVGCCRLALQMGAAGFLSPEDDEADVAGVLRAAREGATRVGRQELDWLLMRELHPDERGTADPLTVKDILLLDLMSRGISLQEIAERMQVTPKTARSYRHKLRAKLDASSVSELVLKAGRILNRRS